MGTHISKGIFSSFLQDIAKQTVKSIDLDIWQPEQMEVSCFARMSRDLKLTIRISRNGETDERIYTGRGT
jgi:hypothetical protein